MVKSGLVPDKYFVGHVELATHFIAALGLLSYTLWFALRYLIPPGQRIKMTHAKIPVIDIGPAFFTTAIRGFYGRAESRSNRTDLA
jgi:cytochrome c oxidase assembly protein subunit 15